MNGNWWLGLVLAAFIVALVVYFLWTTYFMKSADDSATGTPADLREPGRRAEDERTRGLEEQGTPLS